MARFYCPTPLHTGALLDLPSGAARHVQVLRLQPGQTITLFNGSDALEFDASIVRMGRSDVQVQVGAEQRVERQAARSVHLALAMPANERMDWLVEKATELGVSSIQPLMSERSVLRLSGERADKKVQHWHSVAIAACEQCGGNRVPTIHPVMPLAAWLQNPRAQGAHLRYVLSLRAGSRALGAALGAEPHAEASFLCGPEGGLSEPEEAACVALGFAPVSLGERVLRSETAALAALARLVTN